MLPKPLLPHIAANRSYCMSASLGSCGPGFLANLTAVHQPMRTASSEQPPRKVVIATCKTTFYGSQQDRLADIDRLIHAAEDEAENLFKSRTLDLVVLPEAALHSGSGLSAQEQAITMDGPAVAAVGSLAKRAGTYIVLPVILREGTDVRICYNAALLLDRTGTVVGTYLKVHPVAAPNGVFENGVTPGTAFPVFTCDFGKLGIQICWDMTYEEGWKALADGGAEIIALPSMSPQTVRPASYAQRFRYWVVSATPRDNATIYNPIGAVDARTEQAEVLVHRIDLSSAVVHWCSEIEEGQAFVRAFPGRGGFTWSTREDTGLFWSDDQTLTVAAMLRRIKVPQMDAEVERIASDLRKAR